MFTLCAEDVLQAQPNAADAPPGLVGEYFTIGNPPGDFPNLTTIKPMLVRVDKDLDFESVDNDFAETNMNENFCVRWTGTLRIEKPGKYTIFTESDDGSRVYIGGRQIVDNGGVHGMVEKSGTVELAKGDYPVKVEYFQGGGGAGMKLSWQTPDGKREIIPLKALFHPKGSENIALDKNAPKPGVKVERVLTKYDLMDYGPFLSETITARFPGENTMVKGTVIRLTPDKKAAICYDPETLRVGLAWSGKFLKMATGRDGIEGNPTVEGDPAFGTKKNSPGWAKGDNWADPREKKVGSLPHDWAQYKGLYLNGENVTLYYTVGGKKVLEMPSFEVKDGLEIYTRSFTADATGTQGLLVAEQDKVTGRLAKLDNPGSGNETAGSADGSLAVLESSGKTIAAYVNGVTGATWEVATNQATSSLRLKLPAHENTLNFKVLYWAGPSADLGKFAQTVKATSPARDLTEQTKAGRTRWNEKITSVGTLGGDATSYVLDNLNVPEKNPWGAYMRLTGIDFLPGGRIAVSTMSGDVWIASNVDSELKNIEWHRFATGLFQPLGLKVVDGLIYLNCRDQITCLHDLNNDGEADFYECFNNDMQIGPVYHEFHLDLQTDSQGNFYFMEGSNLSSNGTIHNGTLLKLSKDGTKLEVYAIGFRAPNGMGIGPGDIITTSDNQGNWQPECPVQIIEKGGFYGFHLDNYAETKTRPRNKPIVWMPMKADNSSGGQVWVTSDKWGALKGEMLHLSYGQSSLFHIMYEKVGEDYQGGAVRFPLQFTSGLMRGRFSPEDGQLYIAGMRGWQTNGQRDPGCYRVRYTGKPVNTALHYHITKTGMEIEFTNPLDPQEANDAGNYSGEWWGVIGTEQYGSKEFKISDPKKEGHEPIVVKSAKLSADGKKVALEIQDIKAVTNINVKYKLKAADGTAIKEEIDATINRMPE